MARKVLDDNGLLYFWQKIKVVFQPKLTAGTNITIDANNVISAADGGAVDDVQVDGTSVVTNKIAEIDLTGKVDKETGKGLSTNDYTTAEKTKLFGIEAGAKDNIKWAIEGETTADTICEWADAGCEVKLHPDNTNDVYTLTNYHYDAEDSSNSYASFSSNLNNIIQIYNVAGSSGSVTTYNLLTSYDKGVAHGVASLDSTGKVPTAQLPSYVDDVIEAYPISGATELSSGWLSLTSGGSALTPESGKIYVLMADSTSYDANSEFRWGGSTYVKLSDGGVSEITNSEIDTILAS